MSLFALRPETPPTVEENPCARCKANVADAHIWDFDVCRPCLSDWHRDPRFAFESLYPTKAEQDAYWSTPSTRSNPVYETATRAWVAEGVK